MYVLLAYMSAHCMLTRYLKKAEMASGSLGLELQMIGVLGIEPRSPGREIRILNH